MFYDNGEYDVCGGSDWKKKGRKNNFGGTVGCQLSPTRRVMDIIFSHLFSSFLS